MNPFSQRTFGRFQIPRQTGFRLGSQFQPLNNFSELSVPRVSQAEDTVSMSSEATCLAQSFSQESFNSLKHDLCDFFKSLIESNTQTLTKLVEGVAETNNSQIQELKVQLEAAQKSAEENKHQKEQLQNTLNLLKEEMRLKAIKFQYEIAQIEKTLKSKKSKPRKRKAEYKVEGPEKEKVPPLPCSCLILKGRLLTRRQRLKYYTAGKLLCKCNY